ncbi:MAG: HAD family hydrolase [Moraxellaceae bacterium]|nr:HAD family hydrolase [Moraxellaceae bacterium]
MIKLITFDLDNTLWDVEAIVVRAERRMRAHIAEAHPEFVARYDLRELSRLRTDVARDRPDLAHDLTWLRREVLRRAFAEGGYDEVAAVAAADTAFEEYFDERNRVEYFAGVLETLEALAAEFELHALSNGNADIRRVGLGHLFRHHFSAISVGAAKPDPRMYRAALEAAGVAPHEALHVGDHPEQDIAAAAALGMRTVWVNFTDQVWPALPRPDGEISEFAELLPLLRRLQEAGSA